MSVVDLLAHLLGEGQLHSLAVGLSQSGGALGGSLLNNLDLGDGDALLLGDVLAGDSGQRDGLVDTGLDGLGVGDGDGGLNNGDHGDVVASLLGDLLAVVVAVSAISTISVSGLADGHHHGLALLGERDLDSLASGLLVLGLVGVAAHLVVNLLGALAAHGPGDIVALLHILDRLPAQGDVNALGLNVGGAHISLLNHIEDAAVVLGVLVSVVGSGGVVGGLVVGRGGMVGRGVVHIGGRLVVGLGGDGRSQGGEGKTQPGLNKKKDYLLSTLKTYMKYYSFVMENSMRQAKRMKKFDI